MPTPPPFARIDYTVRCRITAEYALAPSIGVNLLTFKMPEEVAPTEADCAAVRAMVANWIENDYKEIVVSDWHFTKIETWDGGSPTGASDEAYGSSVGQLLATYSRPEHAPLVLLGTGHRGRSRRGKVYTFSPDYAGVKDDNTGYTDVHRGSMVTVFTALKDLAEAAGYPLAVGSVRLNTAFPVTGITTSPRLTVQDRRRPGFGS